MIQEVPRKANDRDRWREKDEGKAKKNPSSYSNMCSTGGESRGKKMHKSNDQKKRVQYILDTF